MQIVKQVVFGMQYHPLLCFYCENGLIPLFHRSVIQNETVEYNTKKDDAKCAKSINTHVSKCT